MQLIPRFYDALSGEVLVGGRNVKDYSLYELRESVSMVLQKNMLFPARFATISVGATRTQRTSRLSMPVALHVRTISL